VAEAIGRLALNFCVGPIGMLLPHRSADHDHRGVPHIERQPEALLWSFLLKDLDDQRVDEFHNRMSGCHQLSTKN